MRKGQPAHCSPPSLNWRCIAPNLTARSNTFEEPAHVVVVACQVKSEDFFFRPKDQPSIQSDPALEPMPLQVPDAQTGMTVRLSEAVLH